MKKITILLLVILCVFTSACSMNMNKPSAKDEAVQLHATYIAPAQQIINKFNDEVKKIFAEHNDNYSADPYVAELAVKTIPKITSLIGGLEKEKISNTQSKEIIRKGLMSYKSYLEVFALLKDVTPGSQEYIKLTPKVMQSMNNADNERLTFNNEFSILTTGKSTYELTLKNFQKLEQGDSYKTVANTFKMPGELTSSTNIQGRVMNSFFMQTYKWQCGDANVSVTFENGKVRTLSQFNLK